MAYATTEERATNLFVQPFPATGVKHMLVKSRNNVPHHPIWSPGTDALFYVPSPGILERVPVVTKPTFGFGNPQILPRPVQAGPPASHRLYDMYPDGRILGIVAPGQPYTLPQVEFRVVMNWFDELKARIRR